MGKRKDRRFAANNTSRRVKLDLFAEPTGDLGGSDVNDGGRKQTEPNELPNSPSSSSSSSGQKKTENPLLLLGQYSDDELEEESDKKADDSIADSSLATNNVQDDGLTQEGNKDTNNKSAEDNSMEVVDQQKLEKDSSASDVNTEGRSGNAAASNSTILDELNKQTYPSVQASAPADVTSQWKMILHEESSQYYYWNTVTGETSWEIPAVFNQTVSAYETGYNQSGPIVTEESMLISGVDPSYLQPVQNIYGGNDSSTSLTVDMGERNQSEDHQVEYQIDSVVNYQPCQEDLTGPGNSNHVQGNFDTGLNNDLATRLLSQSEGLLEKLTSLKKSHGSFHNNEQITKYILEVEVRHSDVKALILDTSTLLPFWLHTEKQLKRLEDSINNEIYELAKSAVMDETAETITSSPKEKLETDANSENESEDNSGREGESTGDVDGDESPSHSQEHPHSDVTPSGEMLQKVVSPVVEDIDMDVDMEVEEPAPMSSVQVIDASDGKLISQTDVPPPPGEEWIPPPPSESEEVPPPPPDSYGEPVPPPPLENSDSLGGSYTLCQSYMQQSATDYAAQYNLSYPESSYQYTADGVALAPNAQYYGHVDGSQVSLPQSSYYYETVPGASEVAPAPEAYYNFNSAAPLFPVINIPSNSSIATEPNSKANDSAETASLGTASQFTDVTDGSSLVAKGQPKVKRLKKRTVATTSTLRSNKKVSSLVDKWKAAKEELNDSDDEEEEEEDYGILDKKRRREIEEWKSRQIATGEAKDNANFQPLGGDWREKVKRRKARASHEAGEESTKKKDEKQQKPDLTKVSAQLPSGWQAYWDETSNKVYYGNTITSKTSWTLPTTST